MSDVYKSPAGDERAAWTCKQWYEHVGAWESKEGFICFGSVMALNAMLLQLRAMVARAAIAAQKGGAS